MRFHRIEELPTFICDASFLSRIQTLSLVSVCPLFLGDAYIFIRKGFGHWPRVQFGRFVSKNRVAEVWIFPPTRAGPPMYSLPFVVVFIFVFVWISLFSFMFVFVFLEEASASCLSFL